MNTASLTARARDSAWWSASSTGGLMLLHLVQLGVLARYLDAEDFGRMAVVAVVLAFGSVFSEMGLSSALIQRPNPTTAELRSLYSLNVIGGLIVFGILWYVAPLLERSLDFPELAQLTRVAALVFLIGPWGVQIRTLLQKHLRFMLLAKLNVAAAAGGLAAAVAVAMWGGGVWALVASGLVTECLATAALLVIGIRQRLWSGLGTSFRGLRDYLIFGGFRMAAATANSLNSRVDQILIAGLLGAAPLGIYNVSQRLAMEPIQKLNPVATRVAFPMFSLLQDDRARMRRGFLQMIGLLLASTAPLMFGLAAVADNVVMLFLGDEWASAVPVVALLAVASVFRSVPNACGALLLGAGKANWALHWNLILLLVMPATIWVAASYGSIVTVALAVLALQVAILMPHYLFYIRRLLGPCGTAYFGALALPVAVSTAMAAAVFGITHVLPPLTTVVELAVQVLTGIAAYVTLSLVFQRDRLLELSRIVLRRATA